MGPIVLNHVHHNICIITLCNILPLLYIETLGIICAPSKSPSLPSYFPLVYHGFDIHVSHQRIQTTHSHTSHYHYCHFCNVDLVTFHNVTCYTNSLLACIHFHIADLLNITCTLLATCMILRRLECIDRCKASLPRPS